MNPFRLLRRSNNGKAPRLGRAGRRRPVAFVMSSGASLGAVQVGMLRALVEHDVMPDVILGCSVGALNGAAFAQDPSLKNLDAISKIWREADSKELMPRSWMTPARALARRGEAIHPIDGLQKLVNEALNVPTFEALQVPFHCVATDVLAASEAWFHTGPLGDAVLASAAMPAVYPSIEIDGRRYFDGAAVNDVPVRRAVELGARTVYVLEVGPLSRDWHEPRRPADTILEAYWIARRHRFRQELEAVPKWVDVHVLPHGNPPREIKFHDFGNSEELERNAYVESAVFLDELVGVPSQPRVASEALAPSTSVTPSSSAADQPEVN